MRKELHQPRETSWGEAFLFAAGVLLIICSVSVLPGLGDVPGSSWMTLAVLLLIFAVLILGALLIALSGRFGQYTWEKAWIKSFKASTPHLDHEALRTAFRQMKKEGDYRWDSYPEAALIISEYALGNYEVMVSGYKELFDRYRKLTKT